MAQPTTMNLSRSNFRIVTPARNGFSAAEARVTKTAVKFNAITASELGYPDYVQLLISQDGKILCIAPIDSTEPEAVPFMFGKTADDLNGHNKWLCITNRVLAQIIRSKMQWDDSKTIRRFRSIPWPEEGALVFNLANPMEPRKKTAVIDPDEILMSYRLAQQPLYPVPQAQSQFVRVPHSEVIEAAFTNVK